MNKEQLLELLRKKEYSIDVVDAFALVKREDFVPEHLREYAYEDSPLPIQQGTTISQPSTTAFMLQLLELETGNKILEIGSGSGYVLALLAELNLSGEIYGIEINKKLALESKKRLTKYKNVHVISKSGILGLPECAPFDRILISASCPDIATLYKILDQLNDYGMAVAPVKDTIIKIKKSGGKIDKQEFPGFAFVPLIE